jgi:hypothetical protein
MDYGLWKVQDDWTIEYCVFELMMMWNWMIIDNWDVQSTNETLLKF